MKLEDLLAELPSEVQEQIAQRSKQLLGKLPLAKLRDTLGMAQADIARRLGVSQVAVSRMEGRTDIKLSSMWKYAEATGGQLNIEIKYPQRAFAISKDKEGDFALSEVRVREYSVVHSIMPEITVTAEKPPVMTAPARRFYVVGVTDVAA